MTAHERTRLLLSHGAPLQVIFNGDNDKTFYTLACDTAFYKELGFKTNVTAEFIDVLRDIPFSFDNLIIQGFDCMDMPVGVRFEDFIPGSFMQKTFGEKFLKSSNNYINAITETIKKKKADFIDRCILFLDRFNLANESNCDDLVNLMFFPYKPVFSNKNDQLNAINKNITDMYHLVSEKNVNIIPALVEIGVSTNSILECNRPEIINAVRNQWFNLIQSEKNLEQLRVNSIRDNMLAENNCTADYLNQFSEYDSMLKNIDRNAIDSCKTIKDIIATWPAILQPQPWYVYEY